VARHILDANGLEQVRLELAPGKLTDHYDPRNLAIRLSPDDARDASVAAMAVSAHEVGHALQDAAAYGPLELRTAMFPVVQAGSRWGHANPKPFVWTKSADDILASIARFAQRTTAAHAAPNVSRITVTGH
jgi:hypothetical protein